MKGSLGRVLGWVSSILAHTWPSLFAFQFVAVCRPKPGVMQLLQSSERHRLVTTLLDATVYPADELVVLYHQRWEIEIGNDELKTHQLDRLVDLRSRTSCGIVQELYGILLAYNAVRYLMHEAALSVNVDPRRLSFIHAVRVIRETTPLLRAAPTSQLPCLYAAMVRHIATGRLPARDNRINPRVVKRKMSNFAKKRPEHYHPPQPQRSFLESVVILK